MRLEENLTIKKQNPKDKIYCHEDYAADLYNKICGNSSFFVKKDLDAGEVVAITGISSVNKSEIYFEVNKSSNIPIDMEKEKRFIELHGVSISEFMSWIKTKNGQEEFVSRGHQIFIEESTPNLKASLIKGYAEKMKVEFLEQIKNPKTAYEAKVIGKNQGGFLVDVCGVQAFLPGGLAAANKIVNFDNFIGKNVKVMVEDYLSDIRTFIMSHKKYLKHVLPIQIKEYDWNVQHTGKVTGTNKYGVFVEFYTKFTGLLHYSKMNEETKERYTNRQFKPGDEITCWVREITPAQNLVLTDFEPGTEEDQLKVNKVYKGKVTGVKDYGVFVKLKSGESGLIGKQNVEREFELHEKVKVILTNIKEDKLYFKEFIEDNEVEDTEE